MNLMFFFSSLVHCADARLIFSHDDSLPSSILKSHVCGFMFVKNRCASLTALNVY